MFRKKIVHRPIKRKNMLAILAVMLCFFGIVSLFSTKNPLSLLALTAAITVVVINTHANTPNPNDEEICLFVKDENKKPVAEAKVIVEIIHNPTALFDKNAKRTEFRLTSGADGSFRFPVTKEQTSDPELVLHVEAAHPAYISSGFIYNKFSIFRDSYQLPDNTDFTTIHLECSAKISATVLTPTGKPATAVLVFALSGDDAVNTVQTETRTDKDGKFVIGTRPGKERLLWILPNDAAPFFVALEENDAKLGTLQLQNGIVLKGLAVDADGKPAANVYLSLLLKDSVAVRRHGHDAACRSAVTDADGRFQFRPLNPGQYVLESSVLMEYDQNHSELAPESAYVNLCNAEFWTGKPTTKSECTSDENINVPFVMQDVTLSEQAVQEVEYRGLKTLDLTIRVTNDFNETPSDLTWVVCGELQGKYWEQYAAYADMGLTVKVPVGLEKCYIILSHYVEGAGHYLPFRFRLPNQEKWSNNWYVMLGDLGASLSVDVEPYEPGLLIVACFEPDGKPLKWNGISVNYKNVDFKDPVIVTKNEAEIHTGIERWSPKVEFGIYDNAMIMWHYCPVLADEEFILSAKAFARKFYVYYCG
jgi:uncharacterized GH25 family protein